ncbi:MAG TPA: hypothetical protein VF828_05350 [Patescibacteria group bacterium]
MKKEKNQKSAKKANEMREVIMERIEKEEVKMKPRWIFKAREEGLRSMGILVIISAAVLMTASIYAVEQLQPAELWQYGEIGGEVFFEDFPYLLLAGAIILGISEFWLFPLIGENYKKTRRTIATIIIGLIILLCLIISALQLKMGWTF